MALLRQYNLQGIYNFIVYIYTSVVGIIEAEDENKEIDKFFYIVNFADQSIMNAIYSIPREETNNKEGDTKASLSLFLGVLSMRYLYCK